MQIIGRDQTRTQACPYGNIRVIGKLVDEGTLPRASHSHDTNYYWPLLGFGHSSLLVAGKSERQLIILRVLGGTDLLSGKRSG